MLSMDLQEENARLPIFLVFLFHFGELHSSTVCIPKMPYCWSLSRWGVVQGIQGKCNRQMPVPPSPQDHCWRTKVINLKQYANATFWIDLMARGISMWWREMHAQNAPAPIISSPLPKFASNNLKQSSNAPLLIALMVQGVLIVLSDLHLPNAFSPIISSLLVKYTLLKCVQP